MLNVIRSILAGVGCRHGMARPYPTDLRERVVALVLSGRTCCSTAELFGVSVSSVVKWSQRLRATGSVARTRRGGELWGDVAVTRGQGIAVKKSLFAAEQDRPDVARRRQRWKKYQNRLDPRRLVFIDETWAKTNMTPQHGRCRRGRRLVASMPMDQLLGANQHEDLPLMLEVERRGSVLSDRAELSQRRLYKQTLVHRRGVTFELRGVSRQNGAKLTSHFRRKKR